MVIMSGAIVIIDHWSFNFDPFGVIYLEYHGKQHHNCESAAAKSNYILLVKNMAKHIKTLLDEV